jgi:hypothetical protein
MSEGKGNRNKEKELCETTINKPLWHSLGQGCNSWHLCNSFSLCYWQQWHKRKKKPNHHLKGCPARMVTMDLVRRSLNCFVKVSNDSRLKISYPCPKGSNLRPCRTVCCMVKSDEVGAKAESPPARPRIPPRGDMPSAVDEVSEHSKGINLGKTKRQIRHRLSFIFHCVRDLFKYAEPSRLC